MQVNQIKLHLLKLTKHRLRIVGNIFYNISNSITKIQERNYKHFGEKEKKLPFFLKKY